MTKVPRVGLVGAVLGAALAGWAVALTLAGAMYLSSRGGYEPNDWTYWTYAILPTLSLLGIGWGTWTAWLLRTGVRPVVTKLVLPALVSLPVLLYLAFITGFP